MLRVWSDLLESPGFVTDVVDSGIAAVIAAREDQSDLIFVDVQLRDVPGREAIKWLRSNPALESTPIAILSAGAEDDSVAAADGQCLSLRKPVSVTLIMRTVQEVLG